MHLKISDLEKVASLLLSRLRESNGDEIELNGDYYWEIYAEQLYNPYEHPTNFGLGQLSFDLESLQRLATSDGTAYDDAIAYDLKRFASILTALSIEYSKSF